MIMACLLENKISIKDGDILVLAQKIVSKAEGRIVDLSDVVPSEEALILSEEIDKGPRLVEMILQESSEILRKRPGSIIVEHNSGFVCANAGIDYSNVEGNEKILLLPENSDRSAELIRRAIEDKTNKNIGVMIIDSHGRAWRNGTVGITIGLSGVPALINRCGDTDLFGRVMKATVIGAADELAAGASLMMGQVDEGTPVVHVRGFPYDLGESEISDLLRDKSKDMFR
jgi:coenzyme F420-0:L-glutamate ligase/coenzyme F420-1:gamma-L-glutamate ligase